MGKLEQGDELLNGYQDLKIYSHHWPVKTPKALVLIVHGFGEHCRRYDHVASFFNEQDYTCVGIDLYGHGRTEGLTGHVDHYDLFLDQLDLFLEKSISKYSDLPVFIYAHSMGGNIGLNYLLKRKPNIAGVVVTGPWIDLYEPAPKLKLIAGKLLRNILPKMRQSSEVKEHLLSTDQSVGKAYLADPHVHSTISNALGIDVLVAADFLRSYAGTVDIPLLIMHGEEDQIIVANPSIELANRLEGDVTLKTWPGMYHEIHNENGKENVLNFTHNWIEKYI